MTIKYTNSIENNTTSAACSGGDSFSELNENIKQIENAFVKAKEALAQAWPDRKLIKERVEELNSIREGYYSWLDVQLKALPGETKEQHMQWKLILDEFDSKLRGLYRDAQLLIKVNNNKYYGQLNIVPIEFIKEWASKCDHTERESLECDSIGYESSECDLPSRESSGCDLTN